MSTIPRQKAKFINFRFLFPHEQCFYVATETCGKWKFLTPPHSESGSGVFASLLIYDYVRVTEVKETGFVRRLEAILTVGSASLLLGIY